MPRWIKHTLKILAGIIALILIVFIALAGYVSYNKKKVLALVTETLNKSLNGTLVIGDMEPTLLADFPDIALSLKKVALKDDKWNMHHHTLLQAGDVDVSVNALGMLTGHVDINRVSINNASVYLYTDSTGYSNTAVFKKNNTAPQQQRDKGDDSALTTIKRINMNKVSFTMDNQKAYKNFQFDVNTLRGKVNYEGDDWQGKFDLDTRVKSMAFNTRKGSFLKDKQLKGIFDVSYHGSNGVINVQPNNLKIGDDDFTISAAFRTKDEPVAFTINIKADELLWRNASAILAPNITAKMNMFNLKKPLKVQAVIDGNFGGGGDPKIDVACQVRNNVLISPGGRIDSCDFDGMFTNNYQKGKENGDENSAIKLFRLKGSYQQMPFTADTTIIINFYNPIALGTFKSAFPVAKLNNSLGGDPLKFGKGNANLNLRYKADIVDYQINKPMLAGTISISGAEVKYVPRNLQFNNTSFTLNFVKDDLILRNIQLQSGRSIVRMDGRVSNFLNLYYNSPEKINLVWNIYSPEVRLGEFLGLLNARASVKRSPRKSAKINYADQLSDVFEKGGAEIHLKADKIYYRKFLATNGIANLFLRDNSIIIKNINLRHAGGGIKLSGKLAQNSSHNTFTLNSLVNHVNISQFFYAFDNFGLKSLTSKNLRGNFSSTANVTGRISNTGDLVPRSVNGVVTFDLQKGALLNFDPIRKVGKFAFPFRDLNNITFNNLNGRFDMRGNLITIHPMQISSSVLNMDVAGVYSLTQGTNIELAVPLRNPKDDYKITDKEELKKKRMKGIVVHLLAVDDEDGGIKIKLGRNKKKDKEKAK
ncbi:AsmA family protein [Mucilaginibacter limnophilus]|uniref:AsmA family protein n=1 Tax=Mucilaginibacter limnophilus TaxID=1932778 RepID=A0A3S2Y0N6_9SPHI|nr:AsmA-like C-terminal region-containing protein [Mucilaginibacter limnophilus]RVU00697.1 AsmA family protein [Mucilaginibacter limnophilus]